MNTDIQYQAHKKNGFVGALMNFIIPGAGYMYCGRVLLGLFVLVSSVILLIVTFGIAWFIIAPVVVIDGFLCADRHNKKLAAALEKVGHKNYSSEAV